MNNKKAAEKGNEEAKQCDECNTGWRTHLLLLSLDLRLAHSLRLPRRRGHLAPPIVPSTRHRRSHGQSVSQMMKSYRQGSAHKNCAAQARLVDWVPSTKHASQGHQRTPALPYCASNLKRAKNHACGHVCGRHTFSLECVARGNHSRSLTRCFATC